jgi:small subunit ribosomal protein S25e
MGGTKKKTLASMEKTQNEDGETQQDGSKKKATTTTTKEAKPMGERKRVEVLMPKLSDQDFMKSLSSQKAITVYSAARSLNVSASIARAILGSLESKGLVSKVGGFSGHYVWASASISRT